MNHRFLTTVICLLLCFLIAGSQATLAAKAGGAKEARPNILYFYVDDMGWGSIGPNAQAKRREAGLPTVQTPSIDSLAAGGINFTRAYGCTVCSPARSSQQTGFHQGHTFADRNDPNNAKKAIRAHDITMGDVLSKAGYTTGYWGKWGYGGSKDQQNPTLDNIQTLPTSHGYQHVLAELHHVRAHTFFQPTLWHAPSKDKTKGGLSLLANTMKPYVGKKAYASSPANHNHLDYPDTAYCDDLYATHCLDFVRANAKKYKVNGTPFFGLLAVQIPHGPFGEIAKLPQWDSAYKNNKQFANLAQQTREWAAMVTRIDAHFGNILTALDDPNGDGNHDDSVADNTLVIFMSDNGGPGGKNNVELDANGGLRGTKGSIQEGGIRVPTVMRWPAKINATSKLKAGTSNDQVIDVTDLLPTFCQLAGVDIPLGIDGVSIAPTLTGEGHQRPRDFVIHEAGNGQSIIRGNYKFVRNSDKKGKNISFSLYDIEKDHAEQNDISSANQKLADELKALLLDERVTEPRGFANTYHHWTGKKGAKTSSASNWSDYTYANAGITYMTDNGAPQPSWTAAMKNNKQTKASAQVDANLVLLGFEVSGVSEKGTQTLNLQGHTVTGRNQIRLGEHSIVNLENGTLQSQRWVDLLEGALLGGNGTVDGALYHDGKMTVAGKKGIDVTGDYTASDIASLSVALGSKSSGKLTVSKKAILAGILVLKIQAGFTPKSGDTFTVVTAQSISGRFANAENRVAASDGTAFTIKYSSNSVTVTAD